MSVILDYRRALLNPAYDQNPRVLEERRTALYFAHPYGSRISEYEQVLLHTQPNPDWIPGGIGQGGWTTTFPGGRGAWENYFTEAKSSDWFVFRDPGGRWQRPYVAEKADSWREFQRLVATFTGQGLYRDLEPGWAREYLAGHLGALALHDYGVFMALGAPTRDCLGDTLRAAIVTSALDFLDNAQLIQAEKVYLAQVLEGFEPSVEASKSLWHTSPHWRGSRLVVQELWGETYDHIELLFALHVLHEPLSGRLVRQGFFAKQAPLHGDALTPRVLWPSARGGDAARAWVVELFGRALGEDPKFGDYNRKLMRYWAEKWLPLEVESMRDLLGLWSPSEGPGGSVEPSAERAVRQVIADWAVTFAPLFQAETGSGALLEQVLSRRTPRAEGAES